MGTGDRSEQGCGTGGRASVGGVGLPGDVFCWTAQCGVVGRLSAGMVGVMKRRVKSAGQADLGVCRLVGYRAGSLVHHNQVGMIISGWSGLSRGYLILRMNQSGVCGVPPTGRGGGGGGLGVGC